MVMIFEHGSVPIEEAKAAARMEVERLRLKADISDYVIGRIVQAAAAVLLGTPVTADDIIDLEGEEVELRDFPLAND